MPWVPNPLLGSLGDVETLKRAASQADGVIHLAFGLDFSKIVEMAREEAASDRRPSARSTPGPSDR